MRGKHFISAITIAEYSIVQACSKIAFVIIFIRKDTLAARETVTEG